MKRIAVTGPAGAGKSRLAHALGDACGAEVVHLDTLFWKPGWVATPEDEWDALQRRELARESWVADAQFDDMLRDWFDEADLVVFVDASPLRCLWRVARRRLNGNGAPGTPAGTEPGPIHRAVLKFAQGQWHYRRRVRPELVADLKRRQGRQRVVVVRSDRDASRLMAHLPRPGEPS